MSECPSKVYLRTEIIDGKKKIVDQNGREVAGLLWCKSEYCPDEVDTITIEVVEHDPNGEIIAGGGYR